MTRIVSKKTYAEYFELVKSGQKTFDLRAANFEIEPGDILELVEIDAEKNPTGRTLRKRVGTVVRTKDIENWYEPEVIAGSGYAVVSLADEKPEKNRQIVDENDVVLGAKLQRYVDYSKDIYRVSSLWLTNSSGQILLARRGIDKHHGGLWGPAVNGTVEGVETYLENIVKESEEEIGLVGVEFTVGPKMYFDDDGRRLFVQYYLASCDKAAEDFELEDEVNSVKWVDPGWLARDVVDNPEDYVPSMGKLVKEMSI